MLSYLGSLQSRRFRGVIGLDHRLGVVVESCRVGRAIIGRLNIGRIIIGRLVIGRPIGRPIGRIIGVVARRRRVGRLNIGCIIGLVSRRIGEDTIQR